MNEVNQWNAESTVVDLMRRARVAYSHVSKEDPKIPSTATSSAIRDTGGDLTPTAWLHKNFIHQLRVSSGARRAADELSILSLCFRAWLVVTVWPGPLLV